MHEVERNWGKSVEWWWWIIQMNETAGTINFPDYNPDRHDSANSCGYVTAKKREYLPWSGLSARVLGKRAGARAWRVSSEETSGTLASYKGIQTGDSRVLSFGSCMYDSPRDLQSKPTHTKWTPEALAQRFELIWPGLDPEYQCFQKLPT